MTRELERVLRATFEDRSEPVPPPSIELADSVLGKARGIRRRRALTGAVSAFVVVALAGVSVLTGGFPISFTGGQPPAGDTGGPVVDAADGLDVAVPTPNDGSAPYLRTGDGKHVALAGGEQVTSAVRVPDGFLTLSESGDGEKLLHYALDGRSTKITSGEKLQMAVAPAGDRVAVMAKSTRLAANLTVYRLDGTTVGQEPVTEATVLEGWVGAYTVFDTAEEGALVAWDAASGARWTAQTKPRLRFLGTVGATASTGVAYVTYLEGTNFCVAATLPTENFAMTGIPYCYRDMDGSELSVSTAAQWVVGKSTIFGDASGKDPAQESGGYVYLNLVHDLTVQDGSGSMRVLDGPTRIESSMWLDDNTFLYREGGAWYQMSMLDGPPAPSPMSLPGDSTTFPVPHVGT